MIATVIEIQMKHRRDPALQPAERQLRPLVRPALLRERRADLGHQQHVRRHEQDGRDQQPEKALGPVRRDRAERVEADEGTDREEHHVEAPQRLDQLAPLLQSERRRLLGNR